ncbi:MAG: hypothetical protein K2I08_09190 [Muribaculaceae bacterium]|nr:hypothetical protein [Muribaculaceae bacterium]
MNYYKPKFIMRSKDSGSLRITDLWTFRSTKSNKRYIVEVEGFDHEFYGLKFYWKGVELSKNRYSLLTNDFEPRKIVRSCIEVMLEYYRANKLVSFGFVASPDLDSDIQGKNLDLRKGSRRFIFYQKMMINLFGGDTFYQVSDTTHTIYLMINNFQLRNGLITIEEIAEKINQTYLGDYLIE